MRRCLRQQVAQRAPSKRGPNPPPGRLSITAANLNAPVSTQVAAHEASLACSAGMSILLLLRRLDSTGMDDPLLPLLRRRSKGTDKRPFAHTYHVCRFEEHLPEACSNHLRKPDATIGGTRSPVPGDRAYHRSNPARCYTDCTKARAMRWLRGNGRDSVTARVFRKWRIDLLATRKDSRNARRLGVRTVSGCIADSGLYSFRNPAVSSPSYTQYNTHSGRRRCLRYGKILRSVWPVCIQNNAFGWEEDRQPSYEPQLSLLLSCGIHYSASEDRHSSACSSRIRP